ncbi:hypothetical protein MRB53_013170 [Persea americana]|uniref:Uncharacterized protein n=1 Tax=Persea americana TaxID=3435 RepID=A0ACC2K7A1_PERAE|nr:hypothetical protein MRB53_013170 [Persea americana]
MSLSNFIGAFKKINIFSRRVVVEPATSPCTCLEDSSKRMDFLSWNEIGAACLQIAASTGYKGKKQINLIFNLGS